MILLINLKDTLKSAIIVLLKSDEGKASVAVGVTKDLVGKIKAGEVVAFTAAELGGKGAAALTLLKVAETLRKTWAK